MADVELLEGGEVSTCSKWPQGDESHDENEPRNTQRMRSASSCIFTTVELVFAYLFRLQCDWDLWLCLRMRFLLSTQTDPSNKK